MKILYRISIACVLALTLVPLHAMQINEAELLKQQLEQLFGAIESGNLNAVKELVQQHPVLQHCIDKPSQFWSSSFCWKSPFYITCERGHKDIAEFFLASGYIKDINDPAASAQGTVAQGLVCRIFDAERYKEYPAIIENCKAILRLICIHYHANLNQGARDQVPLQQAIRHGSADLVWELVQLGADPEAVYKDFHPLEPNGIRYYTAIQMAQQDKEKYHGHKPTCDEYDRKIAFMKEAIQAKKLAQNVEHLSISLN